MKMFEFSSKKGFSMLLSVLFTSLIFSLVMSAQSLARLYLDAGRSELLECVAFHAADGGLERGLALVRNNFGPINLKYSKSFSQGRTVDVTVTALQDGEKINMRSEALLREGKKFLMKKTLARNGIEQCVGREGIGSFAEVR